MAWEPKPLFTGKAAHTSPKAPENKQEDGYVPGQLFQGRTPASQSRVPKPIETKPSVPTPKVLFPTIAKFKRELDFEVTAALLAKYQPLTDDEVRLIRKTVRDFDFANTQKLVNFASEIQTKIANSANDFLAISQFGNITAGEKLSRVHSIIDSLDANKIFVEEDTGFFSKLGFKKPSKPPKTAFNDAVLEIDRLASDVMSEIPIITDRIKLFETSLEEQKKYYQVLNGLVIAAELAIEHYTHDMLPKLKAENNQDIFKSQEFKTIESNISFLEKRLVDLKMLRVTTLQSFPQVDLIKTYYLNLINTSRTVISGTIPLWKKQYVTALTLFETKQLQAFENAKKMLLDSQKNLLTNLSSMSDKKP